MQEVGEAYFQGSFCLVVKLIPVHVFRARYWVIREQQPLAMVLGVSSPQTWIPCPSSAFQGTYLRLSDWLSQY